MHHGVRLGREVGIAQAGKPILANTLSIVSIKVHPFFSEISMLRSFSHLPYQGSN